MKYGKWFTVAAICALAVLLLSACAAAATATPDPDSAKPSNAGGNGKAITLTGNADSGKTIFAERCATCHGQEGKGGVENQGSSDGTVPSLNPIDSTIANKDPKVFAANVDLFLEHGSKPEGDSPTKEMPAFGDTGILQPQQIADVIAYVISLNQK